MGTLLEQVKELLKAAQADPQGFEELNKAFKARMDKKGKKLGKQDAHMGGQGSTGPEPGAGAGNIVKDEVPQGGGQTAPSMSGPSNTTGAYGKGEKGEKGETKHDRCVRDVKRNSPGVRNAHAVCTSVGVPRGDTSPDKTKKCMVEKALSEPWTPRFMDAAQLETLEKKAKAKNFGAAPKTSGHKHKVRSAIPATSIVKQDANPDKEADAELGEQVEHDVEQHFKENKAAERKEGHDLVAKQAMPASAGAPGPGAVTKKTPSPVRGVHEPLGEGVGRGESRAGVAAYLATDAKRRAARPSVGDDLAAQARKEHHRVLSEQRSIKPNLPKSEDKSSINDKIRSFRRGFSKSEIAKALKEDWKPRFLK